MFLMQLCDLFSYLYFYLFIFAYICHDRRFRYTKVSNIMVGGGHPVDMRPERRQA